jgi:hypothetical protein
MSVRKNFIPLVVALKERAAFTDSLLLAALAAGPEAHQYLLIDRASGNGQLLMEPPAEGSAERELWDAIAGRVRNRPQGADDRHPGGLGHIREAMGSCSFVTREARNQGRGGRLRWSS